MKKDPISVIKEQLNLLVQEHGFAAASAVITDSEGNQVEVNAADGLPGRWLALQQPQARAIH